MADVLLIEIFIESLSFWAPGPQAAGDVSDHGPANVCPQRALGRVETSWDGLGRDAADPQLGGAGASVDRRCSTGGHGRFGDGHPREARC